MGRNYRIPQYIRLLENYESMGNRDDRGCLIWKYNCSSKKIQNNFVGYGRLFVGKRQAQLTRVVYHHFVDPLFPIFAEEDQERKLDLDHLCRVTNCYEPTHLEPKTHTANCTVGKVSALRSRKSSAETGAYYAPSATSAKKWRAQIYHNGKKYNLGAFLLEKDAMGTYQRALAQTIGGVFHPQDFVNVRGKRDES